jgi:hypothetical protein
MTWIPKWSARAGIIDQEQGMVVCVAPDGTAKLSKQEATNLAKKMKDIYIGAEHGKVKESLVWKTMFQVGNRNILRMDSLGNVISQAVETVPCHNCGFIVPFSDIQIDHTEPQAEGKYVLKVFRALGLTNAPSTGMKGTAFAGTGLDTLVANPRGRNRGDFNHLVNATAADKWTTNDKGAVFLSLFMYVQAFNELQRFCMNSLLNLTPLCRTCNGEKSDWVKPIMYVIPAFETGARRRASQRSSRRACRD